MPSETWGTPITACMKFVLENLTSRLNLISVDKELM